MRVRKEKRPPDEPNEAQIKAILDAEGEKILSSIPQGAYKIALCIEGKQQSSKELAATLERASAERGECVFIIGSSHGLCERVKRVCDLRLSFSKLTFPHRLARVILCEALYRSLSINAGRKYHK